jgi:hypothetical protein
MYLKFLLFQLFSFEILLIFGCSMARPKMYLKSEHYDLECILDEITEAYYYNDIFRKFPMKFQSCKVIILGRFSVVDPLFIRQD